MDIQTLIFSVASELTGGLITDLGSAVIGLLTLGFIAMGLDLLKNIFENLIQNTGYQRGLTTAEKYKEHLGTLDKGSVEYDVMKRKYSKHIGGLADKYHFRD